MALVSIRIVLPPACRNQTPKPSEKQIAEEGANSTKKQRENSGEGWASAGICGGIQRAHLSIDSRRISADLGFAALREAAKGRRESRNATRFAECEITSSV